MNASIGPGLDPSSRRSQPHWKIATMTPNAAPIAEQVHDRRLQRDHERAEHDQQQQRREQHDDADEQRQLVREHGREVDAAGGHTADVDASRRYSRATGGITSLAQAGTSSVVA